MDDLNKATQPAAWQPGHKSGTASMPQVADVGKRVRQKEFQNLAYWAEFSPLTNELGV